MAEIAVAAAAKYLSLTAIQTAALQVVAAVAISSIQKQRQKQSEQRAFAGFRSQFSGDGESRPQSFMLGEYFTYGSAVAPYYANGNIDLSGQPNIPNAFRYQVIDLGDVPITALKQIILGDKVFNWPGDFLSSGTGFNSANSTVHDGVYENRFYAKFYDGTQTTADTQMVERFGNHPERPWTVNHIGTGVPYVVLAYLFNGDDLYRGEQEPLFVTEGIKLYDWRLDSTNGGTGPHRWSDQSTWEYTRNPIVMTYNLMRGLPLADGEMFGVGVEAEDLPVSFWTAAANQADANVFRAGYEVLMGTADFGGMTPFDVIDELLLAANAEIADIGGIWTVRVTTDQVAIAAIDDSVVIASEPQTFDPFSDKRDVANVLRGMHPSPDLLWQNREIGPYEDTISINQIGERRAATIQYRAVTDYFKVQELLQRDLRNAGRSRRNSLAVTPFYANVSPLDQVLFNSDRHGYIAKQMEVTRVLVQAQTLVPFWNLKELDPTNYNGPGQEALPVPATGRIVLAPVVLSPVQASPVAYLEEDGLQRVGGLQINWPSMPGMRAVDWELRIAGQTQRSGSGRFGLADALNGEGIINEVSALVDYEVRIRPQVPNLRTDWTTWIAVTSGDLRIGQADVGPDATKATQLGTSSFENAYTDYSFEDVDFYSSPDGNYMFEGVAGVEGAGKRLLTMPPSNLDQNVVSGWIQIDPFREFLIQSAAWLFSPSGNTGTIDVILQMVAVDTSGNELTGVGNTQSEVIATITNNGTPTVYQRYIQPENDKRAARFLWVRRGGGVGWARFAGPTIVQVIDRETAGGGVITTDAFERLPASTISILPNWTSLVSTVLFKPTDAKVTLQVSFSYENAAFDHRIRFTRNGVQLGDEEILKAGEGRFLEVEVDLSTVADNITYGVETRAVTTQEQVDLGVVKFFATHTGS